MSDQKQAQADFESQLQAYVGVEIGPAQVAEDDVNEPMIRHWCQAMDDRNPAYTDVAAAKDSIHEGIVAPPTMLQAWAMPGIVVAYDLESLHDKQRELHAIFDASGYTGVVATDCEQGFDRYLRPGDRVSATTVIETVSEQKATALGIGYFINTRTFFRDQDGEQVGWMTFRVLKFRPSQQPAAPTDDSGAPAAPKRLRPPRAHDNGWWWDGIDKGELLIQKCSSCQTLRHPPRPMCGQCQSIEWETTPSAGQGTVYSYVVMHHPPIPGYDYPLPVVLVDLEEGIRIVSNIVDCELDEIHIGMRVEANIESVDDELKLPLFRPVR
jgi:uncharacterized OB-fold protein/acyl dehydratase